MSHILCFIEKRIHHASTNVHNFINSSKYSYILVHDGHGLMMMYDIDMHLDSFDTITSDGLEYIPTFNINTQKTIHIVCVYRAHSCLISTFLNNFQTIIQQFFENCLIIIMGDFNVDILKESNQPKKEKELLYFIDKFQLNSYFDESTTKVGCQLDHIWANVSRNVCKCGVIEAYWLNFHKPIYIVFKLPNTLPMYNKKPLMSPFI
jgi:hypothetical protein